MAQPAAVKSASDDQVEQHSVPATVAYHLLPGVVILVVAIVIVPVANAAGFPPIVGLLVGMLFGLSAQLGYLLWLGWKRNRRLSLARVVDSFRLGPAGFSATTAADAASYSVYPRTILSITFGPLILINGVAAPIVEQLIFAGI